MSDLLAQLWTPEMQAAFTMVVVMLVILYILSIVWVARDAYLRGTYWYVWAIVALVPLVGVIAYLLLRPQMLQLDRDEQELEVALKQRQLMQYGECANCGYPVEADYILCPNCHQRLKNLCRTCHHSLDPTWSVCPYCATPVGNATASRSASRTQQRRGQTATTTSSSSDSSSDSSAAEAQAQAAAAAEKVQKLQAAAQQASGNN